MILVFLVLNFKPAFSLSSFALIKRFFSSSWLSAIRVVSRLPGEITTSDTDDATLMAESEEELKSLLMKLKEESGKAGLKLNIQKKKKTKNCDHGNWSHHFMGNRWGNSGNSVRLFWGAPKSLQMMTAAMELKDTCSLEEKL